MIHRISSEADLSAVPWKSLADGDQLQFDPGTFKARLCLAHGVQVFTNPNAGEKAILDCTEAPMYGKELLREGYQRDFFSQAAGIITAPPPGIKIGPTYRGPKGVKISNLVIQGAHNQILMPNKLVPGTLISVGEASGIYSYWSDGLEIDNCLIRGNGNGIFSVGSGRTYDIDIHDCEITGNGRKDSYRQHGCYIEALGVLFKRNHVHDQLPSFNGMACKFRSGCVNVLDCDISDGGFLVAIEDPQESAGTQAGYIHLAQNFNDNLLMNNRFSQGPVGGTYCFHLGDDQVSRGEDPAKRPHPERAPRYMKIVNNTLDISKVKMTRICLFDMRSNDQTVDVDGLTITARNAGLNWLNDRGNLNVKNYTGPKVNSSVRPLLGTVTVN